MSDPPQVREPEMRDNFTDGEPRATPISPGGCIDLIDDWGIAHYGDIPLKISLQIVDGKKLIGIHDS